MQITKTEHRVLHNILRRAEGKDFDDLRLLIDKAEFKEPPFNG